MLDLNLAIYVITMSITPGPNNLLLAASGVTVGWRGTLAMLFGISTGNALQVVIVASSLTSILALFTIVRTPLAGVGCAYLLWLASRQWQAAQRTQAATAFRPMGFWGAVVFQWVNPKAWIMVINVAVLFLPDSATAFAAWQLAGLCMLFNLPCLAVWALAGDQLRQVLERPSWRRTFHRAMALSLAILAIVLLKDSLSLGSTASLA